MNISTKGRYAIRAMLDLALQSSEKPTVIKDIAQRQCISGLYLGQIFAHLKAAGFVKSIRGPKGGFMLAKPPSQIRIIDILQVMEGSLAVVDCVDDDVSCDRSSHCAARKLWSKMKKATHELLESTTLEDLSRWEGLESSG